MRPSASIVSSVSPSPITCMSISGGSDSGVRAPAERQEMLDIDTP